MCYALLFVANQSTGSEMERALMDFLDGKDVFALLREDVDDVSWFVGLID